MLSIHYFSADGNSYFIQSHHMVKPYDVITIKHASNPMYLSTAPLCLLDSVRSTFSWVHKSVEQCKLEGLTWDAVLHKSCKFSLSRSSGSRRSCRVCGKHSEKGAIEVVFELQRQASQHPCQAMVCLQDVCLNQLKKIAIKRQYVKVGHEKLSD